MSEILTLEEVILMNIDFHPLPNGDYAYKTKNEYWHLISKGKDLLKGKGAIHFWHFDRGEYSYETACEEYYFFSYNNGFYACKKDGEYFSLFKNGKDLLKDKQAICCDTYSNGDYSYALGKYWHLIRKGKDLVKDKRAVECMSFDDGYYAYKTEDEYWHLIRNEKDLLKNKKAIFCWVYGNGDYYYKPKKGYCRLIRDDKDLLRGKKAIDCWDDAGGYMYETRKGNPHILDPEDVSDISFKQYMKKIFKCLTLKKFKL